MRSKLTALLLIATILLLSHIASRAQNFLQSQQPQNLQSGPQQNLPSQQPQTLVLPQANPPIQRQNRDLLQGPSQSAIEIPRVLREAFKGCWQGTFGRPSSFEQLNSLSVGGWLPVSYRLCFRWVEGGPLQVTFAKAHTNELADRRRGVSDYQEHVQVVGASGNDQLALRGDASYFQSISSQTVRLTNIDELQCRLINNGASLEVVRAQLGRCNGAPGAGCDGTPWYRATYRATFSRADPGGS